MRGLRRARRALALPAGAVRGLGRVRRTLALLAMAVALAGCGRAVEQRGTDPQGGAAALPAVLVNDSLSVEDRCIACHRGVLDPRHKLDPQPLTTHPGRLLDIHSPLRFGCTSCHGGDGGAAGVRETHGACSSRLGFLVGDAAEIACGKCHLNEVELDGAPRLSHGRALLRRSHCDGCHEIGEAARSGQPGPDLAGIARRTNPSWLFRWLKNPRDYADNARMPRYQLEDRYVDALVGYLMTFRGEAPFDTTAFPPGDAERGKNLVRLSFCISCHAIEGKGGRDAIDLGRVGNKLTRGWMLRLLSDTHGADPSSPMPQYRFTPAQVADVAAYFREELTDPSFEGVEADSALDRLGAWWPDEARRVDVGRRLFKELRCGNCHAFPGGEGWIRVAPILSRLGEKKTSDLPWGTTRFARTLEDYVWRKVENPLVFATAPHRFKMPTYDFTPEEARDATIALLAQADLPVLPEAFVVRDSTDAALPLPGEFGRLVRRYRCLSCHSVNGIGHNISYDLGAEGSRAQRDWIYQYLKLPYTIRPILTVRMPIFNLTDEEARILADGIADSWRDARADSAGDFPAGPRELEAGRRLFERSGCRSCHQVGATGGYVGPSFTSGTPMARRLRRGWIVRWLQNPQAIKPDVLEPRYGFSEAEARALAAYLMTLGPTGEGSAR
ncbi:MAG: c-type cytochrome [Candidatus Eisenbacteria bacterium]|nr:c-type cytochrome [Candidatus Eisenbacteria bacterium]